MASAGKPLKRTRRGAPRRATEPGRPATATVPVLPVYESELLAVAGRLSAAAAEAEPPATSLRAAIEALVAGYIRGGALASVVAEAWRAAGADKRAALSLAWAREQLRLAVADVLAREAKAGRLRADLPLDTLAWAVLAGAEAVMYEPPESAADRIDALLGLVEPPR